MFVVLKEILIGGGIGRRYRGWCKYDMKWSREKLTVALLRVKVKLSIGGKIKRRDAE